MPWHWAGRFLIALRCCRAAAHLQDRRAHHSPHVRKSDDPSGTMDAMLEQPEPDPALDPFRDGVAVLRRDEEVAGYVATTVRTFWAPLSFSRRRHWWVWFIVVWADGHREMRDEDYAPWTVVREMQSGTFSWDQDDAHRGDYTVEWLPEEARQAVLSALNIGPDDF